MPCDANHWIQCAQYNVKPSTTVQECQNLTYLHEKLRKYGHRWGFRVRGEQILKCISSETKQNDIVKLLDYHQAKVGRGCRLY